jgi:hypothetical protein
VYLALFPDRTEHSEDDAHPDPRDRYFSAALADEDNAVILTQIAVGYS